MLVFLLLLQAAQRRLHAATADAGGSNCRNSSSGIHFHSITCLSHPPYQFPCSLHFHIPFVLTMASRGREGTQSGSIKFSHRISPV
mmetsp:Transcript_30689/g.48114  ORF Transcript_30689/g.48114 Transcript_30689/m.48114 type:complete len:86 (+) Transcript_30689:209-466(+)